MELDMKIWTWGQLSNFASLLTIDTYFNLRNKKILMRKFTVNLIQDIAVFFLLLSEETVAGIGTIFVFFSLQPSLMGLLGKRSKERLHLLNIKAFTDTEEKLSFFPLGSHSINCLCTPDLSPSSQSW